MSALGTMILMEVKRRASMSEVERLEEDRIRDDMRRIEFEKFKEQNNKKYEGYCNKIFPADDVIHLSPPVDYSRLAPLLRSNKDVERLNEEVNRLRQKVDRLEQLLEKQLSAAPPAPVQPAAPALATVVVPLHPVPVSTEDEPRQARIERAVARLRELEGRKGARSTVAREFGVSLRTVGNWLAEVESREDEDRKAGLLFPKAGN